MSQPTNVSSTSNVSSSAAKSTTQSKVVSKENLSDSFDMLVQTKQLLDREVEDKIIQDETVLEYIANLPGEIESSIKIFHRYIENFALADTQKTIADEYQRINKLIESNKQFISDSGGDALDKRHALTLLGIIQRIYVALYAESKDKVEQKIQPLWETRRLYIQQQVMPSAEAKAVFRDALKAVKALAQRKRCSSPGQCYFSYVRPDEKAQEDKSEEWVQDFLVQVRNDLRAAGIAMNIDKLDNHDGNAHTYMNRFNDAGFIISVGTPSLLRKHQSGVGAICSELVIINKKRQRNSQSILPILLVGDISSSFPVYFGDYYKIIYTWYQNSYQANLKQLLRTLYNIGTNDNDYDVIWEKFETNYPWLARHLEQLETENIMTSEVKRLEEQKQKYSKDAVKMYSEATGIATVSSSSSSSSSSSAGSSCRFFSQAAPMTLSATTTSSSQQVCTTTASSTVVTTNAQNADGKTGEAVSL